MDRLIDRSRAYAGEIMAITGIDDVVRRLELLQRSLPADDGVEQFNRVYLRVTQAVRDRLTSGLFRDPAFVERLDVVFAERYFAAVDAAAAHAPVDHAWRPLFERRTDPRVQAVQFAVAGMNSHINHDLAMAVVDTCRALRTPPSAGDIPADYQAITVVIEQVEAEVRTSLLDELERTLEAPVEPIVHLVSSWTVAAARDAAWIRAQVRWALRRDRRLMWCETEASSRAVGMTSRHLLTPVLLIHRPPRPAELSVR